MAVGGRWPSSLAGSFTLGLLQAVVLLAVAPLLRGVMKKMKAAFHFAIAVNDDQRQPDAKDKLRQAFDAAKLPATIEVYPGTQHGWCVKDSAIYNEPQAERAWAAMLALYKERLA